MKAVPIKFRGVDENGHCHYGDLVHGRTMGQTYIQILEHANLFDEGETFATRIKVIPDSIRQLVGYDSNGDELYEGDLIVERTSYPPYDNVCTCSWQAVSHLEGLGVFDRKYSPDTASCCQRRDLTPSYYSQFYRVREDDTIRLANGKRYKPIKDSDKQIISWIECQVDRD